MDRPIELRRSIDAILAGNLTPEEIVVSDDSRRPEPTVELCKEFARVRYVRGPQKGQGSNRQFGGKACQTDFVCFIDDDAVASQNFLELMSAAVTANPGTRTVFTGDVLEGGTRRVSPMNMSFWGTFETTPARRIENVNLNSNAFPRSAFDDASFDRHIRYGYEDADFCAQLFAAYYRIVHVPEAVNVHLPSAINREASYAFREHARYYTSLKRYFVIRRRLDLGLAYIALAPMQQVMHRIKKGRWRSCPEAYRDLGRALLDLGDEIRKPSSTDSVP